MAIESLRALEKASENKDIFEVVLDSDCTDRGVSREASLEKMHALYAAIRRAQEGYDPALHSASGMVGGDGAKMREYVQKGKTICGDYIGQVIAQALEMGESNACMKCIVAAPTPAIPKISGASSEERYRLSTTFISLFSRDSI